MFSPKSRTRITVYGSCSEFTCTHTVPQTVKKMTEKTSVNHIGNSDEPSNITKEVVDNYVFEI